MISKNNSDNVLADLKFYENIVNNQTQQMTDTMREAMAGTKSEERTLELVETVAATLGDIMARLQVVEIALAQGRTEPTRVPESYNPNVIDDSSTSNSFQEVCEPSSANALPDSVTLLSDALCDLDNFYYTEVGKNNHQYNWTGKGLSTNIELLVSRSTVKELRIRIVSTLKHDALDNLYIEIDGEAKPYIVLNDGELNYISVDLPVVSNKTDTTLVSLIYNGACTPQSIGTSEDNRHLGIAVNSISVA